MSTKGLVLITGANGYIASVTVGAFLEAGWTVRGAVRRASSAKGLQEVLKKYVDAGKLEVVEVPDITVPGAYDEAVKGVNVIVHMASPVSLSFTDPDPVIRTAVKGTTTVLQSAIEKAGSQLKAFVLTSSIAAIMNPRDPPHVYTEEEWNTWAEATVAERGKDTPGGAIYSASKTAAERAMWDFGKSQKPPFTLTAINPSFVLGPPLVLPESPEGLSGTTDIIWKILSGQDIPADPSGPATSHVDVRDVARVHLWAAEHGQEANGQRYLVIAGLQSNQAVADILRKQYPARRNIIKEGNPGEGYPPDFQYPKGGIEFDSSKAVKATGHNWIGFEKTVIDAAKAFEHYL